MIGIYTYDCENGLTKVQQGSTTMEQLVYEADGMEIKNTQSSFEMKQTVSLIHAFYVTRMTSRKRNFVTLTGSRAFPGDIDRTP